jgi:hypothetical protein
MKKMLEAKKLKPGPKRKLSDSARKRNKKAANAKLNKNRIYIGDEYVCFFFWQNRSIYASDLASISLPPTFSSSTL